MFSGWAGSGIRSRKEEEEEEEGGRIEDMATWYFWGVGCYWALEEELYTGGGGWLVEEGQDVVLGLWGCGKLWCFLIPVCRSLPLAFSIHPSILSPRNRRASCTFYPRAGPGRGTR